MGENSPNLVTLVEWDAADNKRHFVPNTLEKEAHRWKGSHKERKKTRRQEKNLEMPSGRLQWSLGFAKKIFSMADIGKTREHPLCM
jgi:hypothetical protein